MWHLGALRRKFSTQKWLDPKKILPSRKGEVRILINSLQTTTQNTQEQDGALDLLDLLDSCYKIMQGCPGYTHTSLGSATGVAALLQRGVDPFAAVQRQAALLPHAPLAVRTRANALTGLRPQPRDVVAAFVQCALQAGVQVFSNWDPLNDPRNQVDVGQEVLAQGGHFQPALCWAAGPVDATVYNVCWVVDYFTACQELGLVAHSLAVLDLTGGLTPDMAAAVAGQVKEAFPDLPLVFHSAGGGAAMCYLEAARQGANGFECALDSADGGAQCLSLLQAMQQYGWDTGGVDALALRRLVELCQQEPPTAAAGRSVLEQELAEAGVPERVAELELEEARVRAEAGQAVRVGWADSGRRETVRRLLGGSSTGPFVRDYAGMLAGELGQCKEPVDPVLQRLALLQRVEDCLDRLSALGTLNEKTCEQMRAKQAGGSLLERIVNRLIELATPIIAKQRLDEVKTRIQQLRRIQADPLLLQSLSRKIASGSTTLDEKSSMHVDGRIALLVAEQERLEQGALASADQYRAYEELLAGRAPLDPQLAKLTAAVAGLPAAAVRELLAAAAPLPCPLPKLLPPALPAATNKLQLFKPSPSLSWTVLHALYGDSVPFGDLLQDFFQHVDNPSFWKVSSKKAGSQPQPAKKRRPQAEQQTKSKPKVGTPTPSAEAAMAAFCLLQQQLLRQSRELNAQRRAFSSIEAWRPTDCFRLGVMQHSSTCSYSLWDAHKTDALAAHVVLEHSGEVGQARVLGLGAIQGSLSDQTLSVVMEGQKLTAKVAFQGETISISTSQGTQVAYRFRRPMIEATKKQSEQAVKPAQVGSDAAQWILAPISGTLWKLHVSVGDKVEKGAALAIVVAMKMEHIVVAPVSGKVSHISAKLDDFVEGGKPMIGIEPY
eukprot:g64193.t1